MQKNICWLVQYSLNFILETKNLPLARNKTKMVYSDDNFFGDAHGCDTIFLSNTTETHVTSSTQCVGDTTKQRVLVFL